jgi:glycosyltransferase involved in cell wall biosynthesis
MRFTGLTRVRNEADILTDTLDHMAGFCSEVFVFDDASEDDSVALARRHPIVRAVIAATRWSPEQQRLESVQRHDLFEYARRRAENEFFIYLDADERMELDRELVREIPPGCRGFAFRLFDFYMTPDDHEPYRRGGRLAELRRWCGPEYRDIVMAFHRDVAAFPCDVDCVREPVLSGPHALIGYVRHYGKAISVERWEQKCRFYAQCFPRYAEKWRSRQGQAIHTRSDFGAALIEWPERTRFAVPVPV